MINVGDVIGVYELDGLHWGFPHAAHLPEGTTVAADEDGAVWTRTETGWMNENGTFVDNTRLWLVATVTHVPAALSERVRPPGHTCPKIDHMKHVMRQIAWWQKNRPDNGARLNELIEDANRTLELVRDENRMMRAAYYDMLSRTKT